MKITIGNISRDVRVYPRENGCYFRVGTLFGIWNKGFIEPYINIRGMSQYNSKKYIGIVIAFLKAYKSALQPVKPAPLVLKPTDPNVLENSTNSISNKNNNAAGLALWMTNMKDWTPCYHRNGDDQGELWYMRRTRFSGEDDIIIGQIKSYLPYCARCTYRAECNKACKNPSEQCNKQILVELDIA